MNFKTRFKCVVCGKLTGGRLTARGWLSDRSERFPRRHNGPNGRFCEGNFEFAEWIDVDIPEKK
jgi:hypothetical protein